MRPGRRPGSPPRVALATCAELPKLDADEPALVHALAERGVDVGPAVWDDADIDWSGYDLVVVRATWDYTLKREAFLQWTRRVPRILNPPEVLAGTRTSATSASCPMPSRRRSLPPARPEAGSRR